MKPKRPAPAPVTVIRRSGGNTAQKAQAHMTGSVAALAFVAVVAGGFWYKWESTKARVVQYVYDEKGNKVPVEQVPVAAPHQYLDYDKAMADKKAAEEAAAKATAAKAPVSPAEMGEASAAAPAAAPEDPAIAALKSAEPLLLTGMDSGRDTALKRDAELLKMAMDSKGWDAYRGLLERSLTAALPKVAGKEGRNRFDAVWAEPPLYKAFLRWEMLDRFKQADIAAISHDSYAMQMWQWVMENPKAMEELLLTMRDEDDSAKVLVFLKDAWTADEKVFPEFFSLAVACAVVFDHDMAIGEPLGGESTVNALGRYLWYVDKDKKGKLAVPVHRTNARDLVWVVCAPVATKELDWAISKMHESRKNWGSTYEMVEYLMERAVKGINPYDEYSFAEILKKGGICGDRSYFSVNTARANGIPALTLAGETDLGGHAWAAIKTDANEWDTNIGRIGGVSKGEGHNPQTNSQISEQEVWLWNDRNHKSDVTMLSVHRHLWLADFYAAQADIKNTFATAELANQLGHSFPETWTRLYEVMEERQQRSADEAPAADPKVVSLWRDFVNDMRREFRENPRMAGLASRAEDEHVLPYAGDSELDRTMKRERRRIERDSGEQKDLIATNLKREADLIKKRAEPTAAKDIGNLYDSALREYGGSITGFKMMAEDYWNFAKGDSTTANKAVRDIELAFKRVVETGSKDWFRANTESGIYKMIVGYYREVGDEGRANMLEKRYERLLRLAERGAL